MFWDTDFNTLDADDYASYVIVRVMERGTREEVRAVWNYYGPENIKKQLLSARNLSPKTVSYFANQFKISPSKFRTVRICNDQIKTWP